MDAPSQPWSINVARQHDLHLHIYNRMPRPILVGKNKIKIYKALIREREKRRNIMSISDTSNTHMPGRKACWIISRPSSTVTSDSTTNAAEVVRVGSLWKEETYIHVTHKHKLAWSDSQGVCTVCTAISCANHQMQSHQSEAPTFVILKTGTACFPYDGVKV